MFVSLYSPAVRDTITGLPTELVDAIADSLGAALVISQEVPNGEAILAAARDAFMVGFGAGSMVAAVATAVGAVAALIWLPARAKPLTEEEQVREAVELTI